MITELYYGIVPCTKTRVRCVFCGVFIPKATKCIDEHNSGAKHTEIMELVNENGIIYNADQGLYCKLCTTVIPETDTIVQHLQMESHANWLVTMDDLIETEFILLDDFLSGESDKAFCAACEKRIPCTLQNVEAHINEDSHHDNIMETLKPLNGLFAVDGYEELWCKICHLYIEDTLDAIIDHIQYYAIHADWMAKMIYHTEKNGIYVGNYLAHEFENKAYCFKCHAEILCNVDSVDFHVQTDAHKNPAQTNDSVIPPFTFPPHQHQSLF